MKWPKLKLKQDLVFSVEIHLGPKEQDVFHHRQISKQSRETLVQNWLLGMTFDLLWWSSLFYPPSKQLRNQILINSQVCYFQLFASDAKTSNWIWNLRPGKQYWDHCHLLLQWFLVGRPGRTWRTSAKDLPLNRRCCGWVHKLILVRGWSIISLISFV